MNKSYFYSLLAMFTALSLLLPACGPSYPKGKLSESMQQLLKKEYNLDSKVELLGKTLILDVKLGGLTSTEMKSLNKVIKNIQAAMITITRVSLSSDAKIEFLVVNASDEKTKLGVRLIQRLDDIKAMLYQRISRSDYEGRLILEIEGPDNESSLSSHRELSLPEFVARLAISQINMSSRTNPFLSVFFNNMQLSYKDRGFTDIFAFSTNKPSENAMPLFKEIASSQAIKVFKKYKAWYPSRLVVAQTNGKSFIVDVSTTSF